MHVNISQHAIWRYRVRIDSDARPRKIARQVAAALSPGYAMRARGQRFELLTSEARYLLVPEPGGWTVVTVTERKRRGQAEERLGP